MQPTFADPKVDCIFKRIFGSAPRKHLLLELLNTLLELEEGERITDLSYLPREQNLGLPEMKYTIVAVKCLNERGTRYVVKMQLLNVEGFEDRIVYKDPKAFTLQLHPAADCPKLNEVVAVTICDFSLFKANGPSPTVPMLSRWRMQNQHTAIHGLPQVQYIFLELPKYTAGAHPQTPLDKWVHFFREAEDFDVIPPELEERPFPEAFEVARIAQFTEGEFEAYTQAKIAEQDARGALVLAEKQGLERGLEQGLRGNIEDLCDLLGLELTASQREVLAKADVAELEKLRQRIKQSRQWDNP